MVLYCSAIPALIYPLLVHKLGKNHDKESILLYDAKIFDTRGLTKTANAFKEQHLFNNVIGCDMFINRNLTGMELKTSLIEHFDTIFSENGYDLNKFDEIYVLNDTWDGDINLYFNFKKIRYTWIEVVQNYLCGLPHPSINTNFSSIIKKYKSLTPLAKFADACLLEQSDKSQEKLKTKGYTTWNVQKLYEKISPDDMDAIGKCFSIDTIQNTQNSALIIRNSFGYTFSRAFGTASKYVKILNGFGNYGNEVILSALEKISADFYAPNAETIYLKEHPNDSLNSIQMNEIYRGYVTAFTDMPFEFVIKYFANKNIKFDTIIGYSSNSLKNIDPSIYNNLYILGNEYLKSWYYYCSIYTSLLYAVELGVYSIYADAVVKNQLELLMKSLDISLNIYTLELNKINKIENSLIIVNCLETKSQNNYTDFISKIDNSNTVCYLNIELTEGFFEGDYSGYFVPVRIQKRKISDNVLNLFYDENIWIYSKESKVREITRNFKMKKTMPMLGIEFFVEPISLTDSINNYKSTELLNYRNKLNNLSIQYNTMCKRIDNLVDILAEKQSTSVNSEYLKKCTTFEQYLDLLKLYQSEYLILMAVKDTPGNNISSETIAKIRDIGFTNFTSELWRMYIGVSNKSKILYDKVGAKRNDQLSYAITNNMNNIDIFVSSMSWKHGDKAEIIINGIDYSVNMRGINIVIYDIKNSTVIDSIGYDAHTTTSKFIHKTL